MPRKRKGCLNYRCRVRHGCKWYDIKEGTAVARDKLLNELFDHCCPKRQMCIDYIRVEKKEEEKWDSV